jgi:hypothetical protein
MISWNTNDFWISLRTTSRFHGLIYGQVDLPQGFILVCSYQPHRCAPVVGCCSRTTRWYPLCHITSGHDLGPTSSGSSTLIFSSMYAFSGSNAHHMLDEISERCSCFIVQGQIFYRFWSSCLFGLENHAQMHSFCSFYFNLWGVCFDMVVFFSKKAYAFSVA